MEKPAWHLTTNNVIPLFQQPMLFVCGGIGLEYKVTSWPPTASIYKFPVLTGKVNQEAD